MKRKLLLVGLGVVTAMALSGCASQSEAEQVAGRPLSELGGQTFLASAQLAPPLDDDGPGKGSQKDKGNEGNIDKASKANSVKGNAGMGNPAKGNPGVGNAEKGNTDKNDPGRGNGNGGFGVWWQRFRSRLFDGVSGLKQDGWQLGRFKDAFPFAHPPGWIVSDRGDASVLRGTWQGYDYLFQMTRTVQVDAGSLQEWVNADLQRLGIAGSTVRYGQADNVDIAVVPGVHDPNYACPVAYVYLWTANPAGKNQRQAVGLISQEPGSTCNPGALNSFVDTYLTEVERGEDRQAGAASPSAAEPAGATPVPDQSSSPETGDSATGWERTRFFNAFSFAYPQGWSMDRLGDTAHLQGEYLGRAYVADLVWVRNAPRVDLEQWARADLDDLGVNTDDVRIDYAPQDGDAQIAVVSGVRMPGYKCPVVRLYVLANNAAGGGQRSYTVTMAQANAQTCDREALEDLAHEMVRQA